MTTIRFFHFVGFGNYSTYHNWDDGVSFNFNKEIIDVEKIDETFINNVAVVYENSFGGSRNIDIIVSSESLDEARKIAKDWADKNYPEIEYEQ
jgi:hypothetical protein